MASARSWLVGIALLGLVCILAGCRERQDPREGERPAHSAPTQRTFTLALGGDVMLARIVTKALHREGPRYVWGDVLPLLRDADLTLVNLECVIAEGGEKFQPRRVFYFRAHPKAIEALRLARIDCVSLANNHAMDYGPAALLEGIERLDEAGIAHAGAGADLEAAARPAFVETRGPGGLRVAVVSFADHFEEYAATPGRPGTHLIDIPAGLDRAKAAIRTARAGGADLVVFSIHWGPNMRAYPTRGFRSFARAVMDAGADIFHGHSAHVFQGVEIYKGKPILYDTGDLLDDYAVDRRLRNDLQLLFLLGVTASGTHTIEAVPLRIERMQVNRADDDDFGRIERLLVRRCRFMNTAVERKGDRLRVLLRP